MGRDFGASVCMEEKQDLGESDGLPKMLMAQAGSI